VIAQSRGGNVDTTWVVALLAAIILDLPKPGISATTSFLKTVERQDEEEEEELRKPRILAMPPSIPNHLCW
jgi:hypothetical protein